jgi:hypothetical protein
MENDAWALMAIAAKQLHEIPPFILRPLIVHFEDSSIWSLG